MISAVERFLNWLNDSDWFWGPLLHLRPPQTVRMTLRFWLNMVGIVVLFTIPIGAILGSLLAYYDYTTAKHHHPKIPSVVVAESWMTAASEQTVLFDGSLVIAVCILDCFCQHWAWNRRADRLNRESLLQPSVAAAPGVWPPPPTMPRADSRTMSYKNHVLKDTAIGRRRRKARFAGLRQDCSVPSAPKA